MSRDTKKSKTLLIVSSLTAMVVGASACSGNTTTNTSPSANNHTISIVTSTDVWASVAHAVAGDKAEVTALFHQPTGDPHDFEPSAADAAKIQDAKLTVVNGGGYDKYMTDALKDSKNQSVNAFTLLGNNAIKDPGGETNEHVFYSLPTVKKVATAIADKLSIIDPHDKTTFAANAHAFEGKIDTLIATLKNTPHDCSVAQTEPLAQYLLRDAGIKDATPDSFKDAIEEGDSPSAEATAFVQDLITHHKVKALLLNVQTQNATTNKLRDLARAHHVPVVDLTETFPKGVTSYIQWQRNNIDAIEKAVK